MKVRASRRVPERGMEMLQTTECFLCGYGMVYTGCRFCSDRCREAFDAGHSRLDPNQARASHGERSTAIADAQWLSRNLGLPVRETEDRSRP